MFNIGTGEMLAILLLALIVLGPDRLPDAARKAGRYLSEARRMANGFQSEFRQAINTDVLTRPTAAADGAAGGGEATPASSATPATTTPATTTTPAVVPAGDAEAGAAGAGTTSTEDAPGSFT